MASGFRRMVYTDPADTGKPWVTAHNGKYYLWDPPQGQYKLVFNPANGAMLAELVDPLKPGRNVVDVPEAMLPELTTGGAMQQYQKMGGKGQIPFEAQEVVLENLDRQQHVLREEAATAKAERDQALKDAEEFRAKMLAEAALKEAEQNRTIHALQEELKKSKMLTDPPKAK